MLLDIEHRLSFDYDAYISESFMELRVHPKTTSDTRANVSQRRSMGRIAVGQIPQCLD